MEQANRFIAGGSIDVLVDVQYNRGVLDYLHERNPSCHSDNGEALILAATASCTDWQAFSPSFQQCRYVALFANRRIFALGLGQQLVCFRLPAQAFASALRSGAAASPDIDANWVRFELFLPDRPMPDLNFWAAQAYAAVGE